MNHVRRSLVMLLLALGACGASTKQGGSSLPHVEPTDDVGDVVTGSMSAPQSPGLNGPSTPGGAGAGGGTPRPR